MVPGFRHCRVLDSHFPAVGMRQRATTCCYSNVHKRPHPHDHPRTDADQQPGTGIHAWGRHWPDRSNPIG